MHLSQVKMMAKSISEDELFDDVVEVNETSKEEEDLFLSEVLGKYAQDAPRTEDEGSLRKFEYKPLHPSVTETYYTGEREIKAEQDGSGALWHVKMVGGGMVPNDLQGSFTNEQEVRAAIRLYIAKKESE